MLLRLSHGCRAAFLQLARQLCCARCLAAKRWLWASEGFASQQLLHRRFLPLMLLLQRAQRSGHSGALGQAQHAVKGPLLLQGASQACPGLWPASCLALVLLLIHQCQQVWLLRVWLLRVLARPGQRCVLLRRQQPGALGGALRLLARCELCWAGPPLLCYFSQCWHPGQGRQLVRSVHKHKLRLLPQPPAQRGGAALRAGAAWGVGSVGSGAVGA